MPLAACLFLVCLAAGLGSSFVLARALDRIGVRLGLTDAVIGMLTALGADAPEISTAAAAVLSRHDDIGVGVVLGSNVINLAARRCWRARPPSRWRPSRCRSRPVGSDPS